MNNKEFIAELSQRSGYTQTDTQKLVKTLIDSMADEFQKGGGVQISGFGSFEVKKRMERVVVNPGTGKRQLVPPKLVLNFKPVASLKAQIKKGGNDE